MMSPNNEKPIGVFDSGVGGLTVVRALMERLPNENIVYFGDTARVPYGVKSRNTIEEFTAQIVEFLLQNEVKAPCDCMQYHCRRCLQTRTTMVGNMPIISVIEAGAQAALATTRNNHIGVIATSTTVNSNAYARAIHAQNPDTRILSQASPILVPLVEEGWLDHEVTRLTVREYLKPILAEDVDTLVLGCTHYPLLKPLIKKEANTLELVDSSITTAEATAQALLDAHLLNTSQQMPDYRFYVSDIPLRFQTIGERFLGRSLEQIEMMRLG